MIRIFFVASLISVAAIVSTANAQTAADMAKAKEEIWAKEQKIYAGRSEGNLNFYLSNAAPNYVGWPPQSAKPLNRAQLTENSKEMKGQTKEKLSMELMDFTLQGNTAVIYYMNHRTARPDGTPVDEKFENIHVWTRVGAEWNVVGAMSRIQPKR